VTRRFPDKLRISAEIEEIEAKTEMIKTAPRLFNHAAA
jgi:hypothetical protein